MFRQKVLALTEVAGHEDIRGNECTAPVSVTVRSFLPQAPSS